MSDKITRFENLEARTITDGDLADLD
ncbi:hypothetical protein TorRG33x02_071650 [Trema orientale]|uniref:Uncharacterized protein n=1 Tax=Trema orientale TaxID=63057 RepID=A0A2P5FH37_TREOI|nr:hypothetical protein TorRG33x02_071650 [Trema orientale]